jgi:hypothetical protein
VRKHEALHAHEARAAGVRHRHRRRIRARQNLNAHWQAGGAPDFNTDHS